MRVALKYCGGCNPVYDRAALAEKLRAEAGLEWAKPGEDVEHTVVVCGCERTCAERVSDNEIRISKLGDYGIALAVLMKIICK